MEDSREETMSESSADGVNGVERQDDELIITLISCSGVYSYTVPSFPVFNATLKGIMYECVDQDGTVKIVDGFIRDDPGLSSVTFPANASIKRNYKNTFFISAEEFNQSIDLSNFNVVCGVVFVIWKWAWVGDEMDSDDTTDSHESSSSVKVIPETPNESFDEPESEPESLQANVSSKPLTIHTVTFKCIGCTKEECYRKALAKAAKLMNSGQDVPCVLYPEPHNPVDAWAIAFKLKIDNCWQRIGYVVREVQEEVHTALQNDAITNVSIDRIKHVRHWKEPGYYAGINISRIGEWSKTVTRSQSSKL